MIKILLFTFAPIFLIAQDNSLFYSFGFYMNDVRDLDGRTPISLEIGADMDTYTVSLQSDVRRGKTYIGNYVSNSDPVSIDTRYVVNGKINKNHLLGGYGQFTTTAMAIDGAAIGLSYRYINKPTKVFSFFADFFLPVLGYNKIRKWNPVDERVNSIIFGHNLNPAYKARNTEIRFKVGLVIRNFINER